MFLTCAPVCLVGSTLCSPERTAKFLDAMTETASSTLPGGVLASEMDEAIRSNRCRKENGRARQAIHTMSERRTQETLNRQLTTLPVSHGERFSHSTGLVNFVVIPRVGQQLLAESQPSPRPQFLVPEPVLQSHRSNSHCHSHHVASRPARLDDPSSPSSP